MKTLRCVLWGLALACLGSIGTPHAQTIQDFSDGVGLWRVSPQKIGRSKTPGWKIVNRSGGKALRNSAYTRFENHNKQLQHFLDRNRFQQNETWRAEYDRLHALQSNEMTEAIAQRMQDLRDVIVRKQNPKTLY